MMKMEISLIIYIDGNKILDEKKQNTITIKDIKDIIRERLEFYSINYIIKSNDRDYTNLDSFKLMELFPSKKIIELYITQIKTLINEENQRVIMTYFEGFSEILIFLLENKTFLKKIPELDDNLTFDQNKLPYNSRYCNYIKENKLFITGGLNYEDGCCVYDYDINYISNLPKMKNEHQCHSCIVYGDKIFSIGGSRNKYVDCYDIFYEEWFDYPDLNYDRSDPGVCIINNIFLIVFSGYCINKGEFLQNFEKMDLSYEPFKKDWELLSIYDEQYFGKMRSHILLIPYSNTNFIVLGGLGTGIAFDDAAEFSLDDYKFKKSILKLPFATAFGQKFLLYDNNKLGYNFTYGGNELMVFNLKENSIDLFK